MKKLKTVDIATLGMLTALYVVLSAFLKFTLFGNIMVDLGYIAFAFALCMYGMWGTVVGVIGCTIESLLFSAYGFSISWFAANLVIGLICGANFLNTRKKWSKYIITVIAVAVGMLMVKTPIECVLYHIPFEVKIVKNLVAFGADSITMIIGLFLYDVISSRTKLISA